MNNLSVRLRFFEQDGLHYPSQVTDHFLSTEGSVAQVVRNDERGFTCRLESGENIRAHNIVARLYSKNLSVLLEPFATASVEVPGAYTHSDVSDSTSVALPASTHYRRNCVFLRAHDTVDFPDHGLKIEMSFINTTPPVQVSNLNGAITPDTVDDERIAPEVQVESSNIDLDNEKLKAEHASDIEDDEDEDDLDRPLSNRRRATIDATKMTPTKHQSAEVTIKETPKQENDLVLSEDAFQYSTAPDKPLDIAMSHLEGTHGQQSPSSHAQMTSSRPSGAEAGPSDEQVEPELPNGTLSSVLRDTASQNELFTSRKVGITYGKRGSRHTTPQTQKIKGNDATFSSEGALAMDEQIPDTEVPLPSEEEEAHEAGNEISNVEHHDAPTSDLANPHDVAREAATRTVSGVSGKRKLSADQDLHAADGDSMLAKKKQRTETPSEDEEQSDRVHVDAKSKARKGRLPRVKCSTQSSGEEIAVASRTMQRLLAKELKSSPQVVVTQRGKSETPSSTATSSTLAGKTPKILLSNESAAQKSPAIKNWLRNAGANIIENTPSRRSHFVCVVPKEHSLRSAKVLKALVLNKLVVTDEWLIDSKAANALQDPAEYVHEALEKDITHDRGRIFSGKRLFFTSLLISSYKDAWIDIQDIAKAAGAVEADKVPLSRTSFLEDRDDVIFFGVEKEDKEVSRLIHGHSRTVYSKELLTASLISGALESDIDSYKLTAPVPSKKGRRS